MKTLFLKHAGIVLGGLLPVLASALTVPSLMSQDRILPMQLSLSQVTFAPASPNINQSPPRSQVSNEASLKFSGLPAYKYLYWTPYDDSVVSEHMIIRFKTNMFLVSYDEVQFEKDSKLETLPNKQTLHGPSDWKYHALGEKILSTIKFRP